MKLRTLAIVGSMALVGAVACSEQTEPATETEAAAQPAGEPTEAAAVPAEKTAADVCNTIVEAAKAKDIDTIIGASTPGAAEALTEDEAKQGLMAALTDATCGEPVVAADDASKAMVMVTAGETSREVPFIKGADGWRFDVAGYLAKYNEKAAAAPEENADAKGKKAKKAAKKGKKAKKGKRAKKAK